MKMRAGFLATCAASALIIGMGFASPALAADMMVTKAPAAEPLQWWYEGFVEIGGRFNLNSPDKTTLGKFYEYRDLRPGVFGNFYIAAHRNNPIDIALWGKNVGWDDQAFGFDFAKPGQYYVTLGWDQTPHVFGKNARTTYSGGNVLSTPILPQGGGNTVNAATQAFFNANSRTLDLEYRRDTASAAVRWTPTDNWDINADYSHMHRHGTQALSALTFYAPAAQGTRASIEMAKPVDDTTQNGNLKAEYAGSTPWGKPFNLALGGGFSVYNNEVGCGSVAGFRGAGSSDANCLTFQNPWVAPAGNLISTPAWNRYSLAPDNQAQTLSLSGGVGLPFNSRYMGTFQYSRMTQDETFMASTINPAASLATLSANSLNGDARTMLINNVLNTRITQDLKSTLRYRYYDYHSNHSPITILTNLWANPETGNGTNEAPLTTTPLNFNKQNASGELTWRALKWLNTGAAYEWERWLRETNGTDVSTGVNGIYDLVTNENAVKVFGDAKWDWSTLRASIRYSERRYDGNYIVSPAVTVNNIRFRNVDTQNRDSTQGQVSWAIEAMPTVTITPVAGFRTDDYKTNGVTEFGINKYETWNAGGDIAWTISPLASLFVSYMHDNSHRNVYQRTAPSDVVLDTTDFIDTFIVGGKFTAIPDKLFLNASYTFTRSTSKWSSNCGPGGCNAILAGTIFPDTHNTNHRVDASAKYVFDRGTVKAAGFTGDAFVKARVVWEHNSNDSWQSIDQQLGWAVIPGNTTMAHSLFLGMGSPNYDVVVGMLSFGLKW